MTAKLWIPPPVGFPPTSTSASVAAWIEDFRQAMLDIGLVQTADTGQFDAGTYTHTQTTGEKAYLMFAFNDPLQATHPIYIRVGVKGHYLAGSAMAVGSTITVGTATNGAGTITTGAISMTHELAYQYGYTTPQGFSHPSYACFSADKGFAGVVFNGGRMDAAGLNYFYAPISFFVERIPDALGQPSDIGFTFWGKERGGTSLSENYSDTALFPGVTTMRGATHLFGGATHSGADTIPYFQSASVYGPDLFAMHAFHTAPLPVRSNGVIAVPSERVSKGTELTLPVYGIDGSNFVVMDHECAIRPCSATPSAVVGFLFE